MLPPVPTRQSTGQWGQNFVSITGGPSLPRQYVLLGVVVGKLLEGFDQLRRGQGHERPLVERQSSGVEASKSCIWGICRKAGKSGGRVWHGSRGEGRRLLLCEEGSPWENSLFEWWRWRTQEAMNAIASKTGWSSGGEKDASKILRSRSSAENPKEAVLSVALYEGPTVA